MRRALFLALVGVVAWWLLGRRRPETRRSATIGYADGSSLTLDAGSPELDRLVQIASGA